METNTSEESFDPSLTEEAASYHYLILELYPREARAMWYHTTKKMVTGVARYAFDGSLTNLLNQQQVLKRAYKEVLLTIRSSNYLLYPNLLGNSIDEEAFRLTNDLNEDECLQQYQLVNLKAQVIYPISEALDKESHAVLSHFKLLPHVAPTIEMEVNYMKSKSTGDAMWMYTYADQLDLRVYQEGKLKLANSFFQSGKEDIAYFVLYAAEILKIDTEHVPLFVGGDVNKGDETWKLMTDYWKDIRTVSSLEQIDLSTAMAHDQMHSFNHLSFSLLCAS
jgi:hypothetical protein